MKKVLVLYAARSPGIEFLHEFNARGFKTIGADIENTRLKPKQGINYVSSFDTNTIRNLIHVNEADVVVHPYCRFFEPEPSKLCDFEYDQINRRLLLDIVKTIPFHSKLIYISDFSIYQPSEKPIKEKDLQNPLDYYGFTKSLGESLTTSAERYLIIHPGFITPTTKSHDKINDFCKQQIKTFNLPHINYSTVNVQILVEKTVELHQKNFLATFNIVSDNIYESTEQKEQTLNNKAIILDASRTNVLLGKNWKF